MENIIKKFIKLNLLTSFDIHFAKTISKKSQPSLTFVSACLSSYTRNGHTYIPLKIFFSNKIFNVKIKNTLIKSIQKICFSSPQELNKRLLLYKSVSNGSINTPIILYKKKLYINRMWKKEIFVLNFFKKNIIKKIIDYNKIIKILNIYFVNKNYFINWQKIAAFISITNHSSIISGRPRTGKTYILFKILICLIQLNKKPIRIIISSNNFKSLNNLNNNIKYYIKNLNLSDYTKKQIPKIAININTLINKNNIKLYLKYKISDFLHVDLIIIDDASMINLSTMYNLISIISPKTRIILFGDSNHISSVEPGSIFYDICKIASNLEKLIFNYSILKLSNFNIDIKRKQKFKLFTKKLYLLRKNYIFKKKFDINNLSYAVNYGKYKYFLKLIKSKKSQNITYNDIKNTQDFNSMIFNCIENYKFYLNQIKKKASIQSIFKSFYNFRLLCCTKKGIYGSQFINQLIEIFIINKKIVKIKNSKKEYNGKPIIFTENSNYLEIYKNDIGIIIFDNKRNINIIVYIKNKIIKIKKIFFLPKYETAFAVPIKTSTNFNFNKTSLVLTNNILPFFKKELIYTAINSSKNKFNLFSTKKILDDYFKLRV
ncbi:MAG: AAA family ATPase [Candidatus Makana argininalis]